LAGPAQHTRAHWDRFWSDPDPRIEHQASNPKLVACLQAALGDLRGKWVLEAGAGTALDSIELARLGARAVACDYSSVALGFAGAKAEGLKTSIRLMRGDVLRLPFASETFDAVFHAGVLEHFYDPGDILSEQHRILKPGGVLLVDVPQTYNLYTLHKARKIRAGTWYAGWETQYSITELEALVERSGFEVAGAYGYGYYPSLFARIRWASSIGKGFAGRPLMPAQVAAQYERFWRWFEGTRGFLFCAQSIGVLGKKR
jgi:SAM-dependent methyltransferase